MWDKGCSDDYFESGTGRDRGGERLGLKLESAMLELELVDMARTSSPLILCLTYV